ncbi:carbohydrate ABC transporter permease [Paenibacillus rhizoplanae]
MLFSGGLVPFYLLYVNYLDLKDSLVALILPGLSNAFYIFITRTFFQQTIPEEMIESGKLDGASEWRIFFQLVLPISLPVLATIGLFTTLMYWNDWFNSMLFINDTDKFSLQYVMIQMIRQAEFFKNPACRQRCRPDGTRIRSDRKSADGYGRAVDWSDSIHLSVLPEVLHQGPYYRVN